ncbi:MAG: exonuclease SbcCD subunit D C-terminal domain-containing protein [Pseudohongiella sp.]|nr:exonuclease SbcCD subunit D C-terminal domain-containing protein [Pseudohongiella sp.]MDO9520229.1 exonuclease SbcCD subunit D C-terminal domain-containing protein [Pseudohongiella sp.]
MTLKVLHTSDWHLGRSLYGQKRYEEFDALLDWMIATLREQHIDVLLIAGDVFDTGTPSNRAMQQYYRFLTRVSDTGCSHVVIIGGNHDSPTFLNAPRELLQVLNVHVIGAKADCITDEVLVLRDNDEKTLAIVCATPYLRDRDIRTAEAGESIEDKEQKLLEGIGNHYATVTALATKIHESLTDAEQKTVPIIAMGHLFTAGGRTADGDGVRELYVGSLAHVGAGIFPEALDYVALGHLHVPQAVGSHDHIRYCGSPLPMGFGEALQQKSVCVLTFATREPELALVPIPTFQRLRQLRGDLATLQSELETLMQDSTTSWVEIIYTGEEIMPDLREKLEAVTTAGQNNATAPVTILRIKNQRISAQTLVSDTAEQTLDDLTPQDVFERCLSAHDIPSEQRPALQHAYQEILTQLQEDDTRAD